MASNAQHRCVFVGNIPYDATEEQLVQICEEVGPVVSFRLVLDRETGKPKGYGFCEYKDEETALSARRNLQGYEINGRQLRVDFAENDKNAERNREQGRGGPGLTPNIDAPKISGSASVSVYQPLGFQLAETAASAMAVHLGGGQTSGVSNLYGQFGPRSDPLTHHLAKMSRNQLLEIMGEMKALATQNKTLAQQLLQTNPQLSKALFQAQLMLGMVTPQMLPHIRQTSIPGTQPPVFDSGLKPAILTHSDLLPASNNVAQIGSVGLPSTPQVHMLNFIQNPAITQPSSLPLHHIPMQQQFNVPQVSHPQFQVQGTTSIASGALSEKPVPASLVGKTLISPLAAAQPPLSVQPTLSVQPPLVKQTGNVEKTRAHSQLAYSAIGPPQQSLTPQQPTAQFSLEAETALLQQVMSLTPEQLSLLPAEQRQQVIQLQQMLRTS